MSKLDTLIKLLKNNESIIGPLGDNGLLNWMPDAVYLKLLFSSVMGKKLDLQNPKTFNEKLQWLKLYDRNPRYSDLVDKVKAKSIIASTIGKEYIVPLIGKWDNANDIDFSELPDKVVLKCNHDQGSVRIIDNLSCENKDELVQFYSRRLKRNPYPGTREFAYRDITPMVFAEEYLGERIVDYKFYCFNGEPKFLYCGQGLTDDHSLKIDFYNMDWEIMPFYRTDYLRLGEIPKPTHFQEMIDIAKKLSEDVPFVRIDLFEVNDRVYFSEFTLCPASGLMPFVPEEYDLIVGNMLNLEVEGKAKNNESKF